MPNGLQEIEKLDLGGECLRGLNARLGELGNRIEIIDKSASAKLTKGRNEMQAVEESLEKDTALIYR